jgi:YD repeat-containing protein
LCRLVWAGNTGTPSGGDHCGNAPSGTTLSTYQQSFSYDNLDRLTSGPAGTITYGDSSHVHAATNLSSIPNQYASYDAMGNMTCRNTDTTSGHTCGNSPTGARMSYDVEGRLTSWTAPSGTTASDSFLYDGEGNRVLQETNTSSITDTITFDGYTETVITGGTITPTKYYSANGQRVAMRTNSTLSYLLSDVLGSSTVALDSTGATQAVQLFAPYGTVRYSQGSMPTAYNFTGQRLDKGKETHERHIG